MSDRAKIPGPKEAAPCRSCAHWKDQVLVFSSGILAGDCAVSLNPRSFHTYGVDDQSRGEAICHRYIHEGWQW